MVVCDSSVHETMFAGGPDGPNGKPLGMERWLIDPRGGKVERITLDTAPQEFHRPDHLVQHLLHLGQAGRQVDVRQVRELPRQRAVEVFFVERAVRVGAHVHHAGPGAPGQVVAVVLERGHEHDVFGLEPDARRQHVEVSVGQADDQGLFRILQLRFRR